MEYDSICSWKKTTKDLILTILDTEEFGAHLFKDALSIAI
jgi:hypothetical protein